MSPSPLLAALRRALWLCTLLWTGLSSAHSVSSELSLGRGFASLRLSGDVAFAEETRFLNLSYGLSRSPSLSDPAESSPAAFSVPDGRSPLVHHFSLGLDQIFGTHWLMSLQGALSPDAVQRTPLLLADTTTQTSRFTLLSSSQSLGALAAVHYESAGFSSLEYGLDATAEVVRYRLGRAFYGELPRLMRYETLWVGAPTLGATLVRDRFELSLRASYFFYSSDPLTTGRFTDEELAAIDTVVQAYLRRIGASDTFRRAEFAQGRMLEADAVSGLPSAPLWFEARAQALYRLSKAWKGQVTYAMDRYVPSQGLAHVLSTKWTWKSSETFRMWLALSVQRDVPFDATTANGQTTATAAPPASTSALASLGAELSF